MGHPSRGQNGTESSASTFRRAAQVASQFRQPAILGIYCQNLIDDAQQRIEGWLDCVPAIDRDIDYCA